MRPTDKGQRQRLAEITGAKSVVTLDEYLGVSHLPFKLSLRAMLEVAYWAQNQCSYERAEKTLRDKMRIETNDVTVRLVANYIGSLVFQEDCLRAKRAIDLLDSGKLSFPMDKDGVLYIQTDGAALNTRTKDESGSTWRENKLGEVFSSDNIRYWDDRRGERQHKILKKEYISFIGSVEEFKKHLFAVALRNGYGRYKETVFISDGATWIRKMIQELYPDAQQILDFYHLCENVNEYAKHLFNMDENRYKPWAKDICEALRASEHKRVLDDLSTQRDRKVAGCGVDLFGYISNNINNIDYVEYIGKGYFIGSGAIESGNKTILQQRLKQAGMRWNIETAQPLLTLRSKWESGLWDDDVVRTVFTICRENAVTYNL